MTAHQNRLRPLLIALIAFPLIAISASAQDRNHDSLDPIIESIEILESEKDPKCHATANRLEDFMFGTPLTFEARDLRIQMQKKLVRAIWQQASEISEQETIDIRDINRASIEYINTVLSEGQIYLKDRNTNYVPINSTDLRQYSSIAYSLRAILAVQQEDLFAIGGIKLKRLGQEGIDQLKVILDMASLAALYIADNKARLLNMNEVDTSLLLDSWSQILQHPLDDSIIEPEMSQSDSKGQVDHELLTKIIDQKLTSYQRYNDLSQKLFLRNIQVYFAKKQWPKSEEESQLLIKSYQDALVQYGAELYAFSQGLAVKDKKSIVRLNHINTAINAFLPFEINEFEDVTYFPLLRRMDRVTIESYDLDAFRDSGLHWQILKFIIDDPNYMLTHEIDPHASELLVEAIAQFGVLLWRMSGVLTEELGKERLSNAALMESMSRIRSLTQKNNGRHGTGEFTRQAIASNPEVSQELLHDFIDVTDSVGLHFLHRSADWLHRQLRSYLYEPSSNIARLAIPPAFGGGGIAAEDINHDGYDDLLLLGGGGNKVYLNNNGRSFIDYTASSGIANQREDGSHNEPRQAIICDFNNDGHQDILITYVDAQHQLYEGIGDGSFIDRSDIAELGGKGLVGGPATVADFNEDGMLDIYIGYFGNYIQGALPTLKRDNDNGTPNQLFLGEGAFRFSSSDHTAGIANTGWTQAVGHSDINNDGYQDIIVGNDFGTNAYYINDGNARFTDQSASYATDKPSYTMNVGIADLNRDQYPDFYISNIVVMEKDDKYVLPSEHTAMHFDAQSLATMRVSEANDLFISLQNQNLVYEQSTLIDRGYAQTGWSWDADFFDYDNDGDEDLYVLNGMNPYSIYGQENAYYQSPQGEQADVLFAKSNEERNVFFKNENGRLNQYSVESGLDLLHTSRSAVYTDYDLDGDLDVVINNYHGKAYIYQNQSEQRGRNWIKVRLQSNTLRSNLDAIGARVSVSSKLHKDIWREVHSTDGYLSGHPKTLHFGLGSDTTCIINIRWPDGRYDSFEVSDVNQQLLIRRNKEGVAKIN